MMAIENVVYNIARFLKKDPSEVRKNNFYGLNEKNYFQFY